jgi:hypothetical protein
MIARGEKMFAGNEPVSGTVRGAWRAGSFFAFPPLTN